MIKNEQEYAVTLSWVKGMERAIAMLEQDEDKKKNQLLVWQLHYEGVTSQHADLSQQVAEYEALVSHDPTLPIVLSIDSFDNLSDLLIKARIAFKITQRELAALCNRTEEQIKAFEEKNYSNASFLDFREVASALGVEMSDGKFIAKLDDFYLEHLANIREASNINILLKEAS